MTPINRSTQPTKNHPLTASVIALALLAILCKLADENIIDPNATGYYLGVVIVPYFAVLIFLARRSLR